MSSKLRDALVLVLSFWLSASTSKKLLPRGTFLQAEFQLRFWYSAFSFQFIYFLSFLGTGLCLPCAGINGMHYYVWFPVSFCVGVLDDTVVHSQGLVLPGRHFTCEEYKSPSCYFSPFPIFLFLKNFPVFKKKKQKQKWKAFLQTHLLRLWILVSKVPSGEQTGKGEAAFALNRKWDAAAVKNWRVVSRPTWSSTAVFPDSTS